VCILIFFVSCPLCTSVSTSVFRRV